MAEFPALPLFTDAYMADTRHLTTLQHGAYLLMLMTAWRMPDCSLPDDDIFLSRICGLDKRTWSKNKLTILAFWHKDEKQNWCQGRLKDERNYVEQLRNKNSLAGKASALKNKNRHLTTVQPNFNQTSTPTPTPIPIPIKEAMQCSANVDANLLNNEKNNFQKIYETGSKIFPQLATKNTSAIHQWLSSGCDVELDILPEIQRHAGKQIGSWTFFSAGISQAKITRLSPLSAISARASPQKASDINAQAFERVKQKMMKESENI